LIFMTAAYDKLYEHFDSPLMRQLRAEAYGKDIGQHSWVTAEELLADIPKLNLSPENRLLDLGCGPAGPLTLIAAQTKCTAVGLDLSANAIDAARARAASVGLSERITVQQADLNEALPFTAAYFHAVLSIDVILHLRDRSAVFREIFRVLTPGGTFLFTDAGVITGPVSSEEIQRRTPQGCAQFVPPGINEQLLERAGFQVTERTDLTDTLIKSADGRLAARASRRSELETLEGHSTFEQQQQYLQTVVTLAERAALSRIMYVAKSP
jgi:cyclopropane fatty-acyl-phospholipid synthase-like methyltransferase